MRLAVPYLEEHGAFQDEVFAMLRTAEAVQQALRPVPHQELLVVFAARGERAKASRHRGGNVADQTLGAHAVRNSRYGLITLCIRQAPAASQIWSMVAIRRLQTSRSASRATSSPILFRYLKQSATVFAGL
jgi:hypothetical protein